MADVKAQDRPAVLVYAGDFDPSGEDIDRDFIGRTDVFERVLRVALNAEQIELHHLPPQPGKPKNARAAGFIERHGRLMQVELDALPPDVLQGLYQDAIDQFWDLSAYEDVVDLEDVETRELL